MGKEFLTICLQYDRGMSVTRLVLCRFQQPGFLHAIEFLQFPFTTYNRIKQSLWIYIKGAQHSMYLF